MIGVQLVFNNRNCQVIEVLEDGPSIVIQYESNNIQQNQHGEAHRKVPETQCIPVLSSDKTQLSEIFLSLDLIN